MNSIRNTIAKIKNSKLCNNEEGLSTVEYIIILVLIAVLAIGVWKEFGKAVQSKVTTSTTSITNLNKKN